VFLADFSRRLEGEFSVGIAMLVLVEFPEIVQTRGRRRVVETTYVRDEVERLLVHLFGIFDSAVLPVERSEVARCASNLELVYWRPSLSDG
jgi:uncharacterized protein YhhL (DUF1145 family)